MKSWKNIGHEVHQLLANLPIFGANHPANSQQKTSIG